MYASIVQHPVIQYLYAKLKLRIKDSCLPSTLLYKHKINMVYSNPQLHYFILALSWLEEHSNGVLLAKTTLESPGDID